MACLVMLTRLAGVAGGSGKRRRSISSMMMMKYHGFWRKERLPRHVRHHPGRLDVRPVDPTAVLPDHVSVGTHSGAATDVAAPAVVSAIAVDAHLAVRRSCYVCHAGRERG
jgi:hypothetical protein